MRVIIIILWNFFVSYPIIFAQSPGVIVRPAGGNGITLLNPDGNGFSSSTTSGFITDDIVESEVNYKLVPPAITEPTGDLATGPSGGFTDIVRNADGSGFYLTKIGTNIYFRLRIGKIISGSKGYSVLIDTDQKFGGSGAYSDPNYVAPSGSSPGNPGFEYEVVLQTNFQVAVYAIDGSSSPGSPTATYALNTNSQISVALTTDGNNADYFYDWVVPVSTIGNPSAIRTAVTTIISPNSALQGTRSDIYGIDDSQYSSTAAAWQTVVNAQPAINLNTFTTVGATCTQAPVLSSPITAGGSVTVSGTWSRLDASKPSTATITLYKNGISAGTVSANTGSTWNISGLSIASGDILYAMAQSTGESQCLQSNNITAAGCSSVPSTPVLTCASTKGISGTMSAGSTIAVYLVPTTTASLTSNQVSTAGNLTYPNSTSFAFISNNCTASPTLTTGTYLIVANNGCNSSPRFECITSGNSSIAGLASNSLSVSTPLYPYQTSISGTGATSGNILRLYINGKYISTITATGSSFSFSGLTLNAGDQIQVYLQSGSSCMTQSSVFTVSCFTQAPVINVNSSGYLLTGATNISGSSSVSGGSLQLYKGTSPSGVAVGSPVSTASNGSWSVTTSALTNGDNYYAVLTSNGCNSASSSAAQVTSPASCPTISGSYTDASTTITGTMSLLFTGTIRLYVDGVLAGSQNLVSLSSWSITPSANSLYYGAVLTVTAQGITGTESSGCGTKTVGCTSPLIPSLSPSSTTINLGQTVSYNVSNVNANTWYALTNSSGASFATSSYRTTSSNFSMASKTFNSAGTFNLNLSCDALNGCPASTMSATVIVNAVLPLKFLNVIAKRAGNHVQLLWEIADPNNVDRFEIERSNDGLSFIPIASQRFSGASRYNYTDSTANDNLLYYRIKEVDIDEKYLYSKIVSVNGTNTFDALIYPNPAKDKLQVSFSSDITSVATVTMTDIFGRVVWGQQKNIHKGNNIIYLQRLTNAKGIYMINIFFKNKIFTGSVLFNP